MFPVTNSASKKAKEIIFMIPIEVYQTSSFKLLSLLD